MVANCPFVLPVASNCLSPEDTVPPPTILFPDTTETPLAPIVPDPPFPPQLLHAPAPFPPDAGHVGQEGQTGGTICDFNKKSCE